MTVQRVHDLCLDLLKQQLAEMIPKIQRRYKRIVKPRRGPRGRKGPVGLRGVRGPKGRRLLKKS